MGLGLSRNMVKPVNYNCPVCMEEGKIPNLAGRFFIINQTQCKCNGCNSIFPKEQFFKNCSSEKLN